MFIGRIVQKPVKRYTETGLAVTSFSIAVDRHYPDRTTGKPKTDFFRCKAWRDKADFIAERAKQGNLIAVDGRQETSEVINPDGSKRYFIDLVIDNFEFLGGANGRFDGPGNDDDDVVQPNDASDPYS